MVKSGSYAVSLYCPKCHSKGFTGQKETDHCRGSDEISYCSLSPSSSILVRKRGRCFSWLAGQWISPSLEISVSRSVLPCWDFAWNTTSATNKLHKTTTAFSTSMLCSWAKLFTCYNMLMLLKRCCEVKQTRELLPPALNLMWELKVSRQWQIHHTCHYIICIQDCLHINLYL